MAIARSLQNYLEHRDVEYDVLEHAHSRTALETAHAAHVPESQVAKAVVLEDDRGYVVAVVPSRNRVDFGWLRDSLGRSMRLAAESELQPLFRDCELGAVPAFSDAYGLDVIWDDQLDGNADIYVEAGDHEHLVHVSGEQFSHLMANMPHSVISAEHEYSSLN
ncbi:YbaK/EbsC family protein [Marinihelvus fidelis]|uniref:YbaK/EbsC family protein n=1 Tax=Marinihelvus fidelis TaxID=2613842 RepID=A0A5N0T8F8_9GAMM|nr:YbaK/EbsC family protein [Marinihelvus fidelis]KAA9129589.1 YbaK/EbsC family protein [Marinihelvus fidelis]